MSPCECYPKVSPAAFGELCTRKGIKASLGMITQCPEIKKWLKLWLDNEELSSINKNGSFKNP